MERKIDKMNSRGETESKDVLNSERVSAKHLFWGRQHLTGVSTTWIRFSHCNLARKNCGAKLDHDANGERAKRARKREQLAVERQER